MNVFSMFVGSIGTLTFVVGMIVLNRIESTGTGLSLSDVISFLFYAFLTSLYVGIVLGEKNSNVTPLIYNSLTKGEALSAWSVGFTFSVMLERFSKKNVSEAKAPSAAKVDQSVSEETFLGETPAASGSVVSDRNIGPIKKSLVWLTSSTQV